MATEADELVVDVDTIEVPSDRAVERSVGIPPRAAPITGASPDGTGLPSNRRLGDARGGSGGGDDQIAEAESYVLPFDRPTHFQRTQARIAYIAMALLAGLLAASVALVFGAPEHAEQAIGIVDKGITALVGLVSGVIGYYFGKSSR